jgi:hydrogenase maturation protease
VAGQVLVAGIGNIFLGDDGFGPEVVRRLAEHAPDDLAGRARVVDYGIRGMHLAYDLLDGYDVLVLVDALPGDGPPGEVTVLQVGAEDLAASEPREPSAFDAHGMDPTAVLAILDALGGTLPPTYVVGCRPVSLEDGIGLSAEVAAAVPAAVETVRRLLRTVVAEPGRVTADDGRR